MALRLDPDFLQKLEYLHVVSRRAFAGRNRADRQTNQRGRGIEFADHRPYAAGDDFRHIDWKAYKRLNRLLLRLFNEEQDLPIHLFIDVSRSMAEPGKFDHAKRLVASLCYIGLSNLDHVTILPFGSRLLQEIHPGRGQARIIRVLDDLDALTAEGETSLHHAFTQFAARARPRGLAVVISDFLDPGGFEPALKLLASLGHEVYVVHVSSGRDRRCDVGGEIRLVDSETGATRDVDVTPALADAYARAFTAHASALQAFCARYQLGYLHADTERPFEEIVLDTFRAGRFLA